MTGEVNLLKLLFGIVRQFLVEFIEMKYTSVPYWRPWRDF
jgi:hypothetical protein